MDDESDEFMQLDDCALLSRRAQMRAELERLPPASPGYAALSALYDRSTEEVNDRARKAWSRTGDCAGNPDELASTGPAAAPRADLS